jgi:hypothetical protein
MADLCFCLHYLLQEVMLADAIFGSRNQSLFNVILVDEQSCLSIRFFFVFSNAGTPTSLAIALYIFYYFRLCLHVNRPIIGFIVICWIVCSVVRALAVWLHKEYYTYPEASVDLQASSLLVFIGCVDSVTSDDQPNLPYVVNTAGACLNAVSSLAASILYFCLYLQMRKTGTVVMNFRQSDNRKINHLRIRFIVISILSLFIAIPISAIFLYKNGTVYDGSSSFFLGEPIRITVAAWDAVNPIIYTVATKPFFRCVRRASDRFACRCQEGLVGNVDLSPEDTEESRLLPK